MSSDFQLSLLMWAWCSKGRKVKTIWWTQLRDRTRTLSPLQIKLSPFYLVAEGKSWISYISPHQKTNTELKPKRPLYGQFKEAVSLLEHVVEIREQTLAEDHPDRLASQHVLAKSSLRLDARYAGGIGLAVKHMRKRVPWWVEVGWRGNRHEPATKW